MVFGIYALHHNASVWGDDVEVSGLGILYFAILKSNVSTFDSLIVFCLTAFTQ